VVLTVIVSACAAFGFGTTSAPSPGCGYNVKVVNKTRDLVIVTVNGKNVGQVGPDAGVTILDGLPPKPWDVVVTHASDGVVLASHHYDDTESVAQTLTVQNAAVQMDAEACL
jgi:hypothetical protein